ncbi:tetrapyrrole biosynthesis, uroporphyrinogen III synthase [Glomus cerebriforme]|uniref:Tetrapyrrole biosynthesis, uroporphyrinogen III synthase n=1 Tax=Glomus cerebriforme TaxID=658196 RepID=A0A397TKX8_9GLOM|nr:tetrapyrrole biosynthesis, uroporphyrinogen III synthase [Glomus cerebriforme]
MSQPKTILLLKEKTIQIDSNVDVYEQKFGELGNYKVLYLPPLDHSLVNINELISILKNGPENNYRGVITTSQRAVEGLKVAWEQAFSSSGESKDVLEKWKKLPYFVVGKSTAKAIKELNVNSFGADESGNSELLANYILKYFNSSFLQEEGNSSKQLELLFLVGDKRRDELPNKLLESGFLLKELLIYETKPNSTFSNELNKILNSHEKKKIDWIVFFSPSGVDISLDLLKNKLLEDWNEIKIASIGKTTSNYLEKIKKINVNITSPKPEAESLSKSIHEYNI